MEMLSSFVGDKHEFNIVIKSKHVRRCQSFDSIE